ncbi:SRPBCC family protein [Actinomycetospora lutea]|uniref:SRPBCC family protein n=1 Tax=Actinomycetospora lutea TaxID=663604 RepID=UPI002366C16E|nr:SRPBCC family protein [Actinomycetospora lutea]MDD7939779.1 SRPBCC family protein [Actinomycetospora lutea]
MGRVDVESAITIRRPRDEVAAFASDPDNATQWYENIASVEWETPRPVRPGSRIAFVAHFLGRRLAYVYEVRELETARRYVMSTAHGPFPMETTYSWEDTADGGTRMTVRNRGEPSGFAGLGAPLVSAAMRRATARDLRALKDLLEARATRQAR